MEISEVRKRVLETIDRAKRRAAERRARADDASREYERFLERAATPIFRQIAQALRAAGYPFSVFTPGGSVRLMSDRSSEDYIELALDTTGREPMVVGHTRRGRGGRVVEAERPIAEGKAIGDLTDADVLDFVVKELEPFVEK